MKSKTLMNKIQMFRDATHLDKIHVFDAISAYEASNFNRHQFYKATMDLLLSKKVIDLEQYDKKMRWIASSNVFLSYCSRSITFFDKSKSMVAL